jgi:hypothetical protein
MERKILRRVLYLFAAGALALWAWTIFLLFMGWVDLHAERTTKYFLDTDQWREYMLAARWEWLTVIICVAALACSARSS